MREQGRRILDRMTNPERLRLSRENRKHPVMDGFKSSFGSVVLIV